MQSRGRSAPGLLTKHRSVYCGSDEDKAMALTRDFKQTILARTKRDPSSVRRCSLRRSTPTLPAILQRERRCCVTSSMRRLGSNNSLTKSRNPARACIACSGWTVTQTPRTSSASLAHCKGRPRCGCRLPHTSKLSPLRPLKGYVWRRSPPQTNAAVADRKPGLVSACRLEGLTRLLPILPASRVLRRTVPC